MLETIISVSYTHLDVYKRQVISMATVISMVMDILIPVSYTHLDVYKRQILLKNKTLRQATPANPMIVQFNKDITQLKRLIKEGLEKSKELILSNISYQQGKISEYKHEMTMFPEQENFFKNIDRQQKIKEALYLYLLQKNEEISMALAVTTPKVKVLNPAFTTGVMTPNVSKIMMFAYSFGFFLPCLLYTSRCV